MCVACSRLSDRHSSPRTEGWAFRSNAIYACTCCDDWAGSSAIRKAVRESSTTHGRTHANDASSPFSLHTRICNTTLVWYTSYLVWTSFKRNQLFGDNTFSLTMDITCNYNYSLSILYILLLLFLYPVLTILYSYLNYRNLDTLVDFWYQYVNSVKICKLINN